MKPYRTEKRSQLMTFLKNHRDEPLTAEQIADGVRGIALSTVYRNLAQLCETGDVHKSLSADGHTVLYQYYDKPQCASHLHLKCVACGGMTHMESELSHDLAEKLSEENDFSIDAENTVILGVCKTCHEKTGENKTREETDA